MTRNDQAACCTKEAGVRAPCQISPTQPDPVLNTVIELKMSTNSIQKSFWVRSVIGIFHMSPEAGSGS